MTVFRNILIGVGIFAAYYLIGFILLSICIRIIDRFTNEDPFDPDDEVELHILMAVALVWPLALAVAILAGVFFGTRSLFGKIAEVIIT